MAAIETSLTYRRAELLDRGHPFLIVAASIAVAAAVVALPLTTEGLTEYGWRTAVQYSGRVAVLLFLIPFLAGPIARLLPSRSTRGLLIDRRAYGIGFALAFAIYLATVLAPFVINHEHIPPTVMVVSGIGAALIASQLLTANAFSIRVLGFRAWSKLHTFAMYCYWIAFTVGFLDRVVGPSRIDPFMQIGLCLMIGALLIRFAAAFATKLGYAQPATQAANR
jgi:hypothetical protein